MLKPAEQTPLTALRLAELMAEAGIPDGVVNVVTGFGETAGAALAAHPDVDKIAFTGSTEVGKLIVHAAAGNLKKVTLELGGKSPNIVFADADHRRGGRGRRERDLLQPGPVLRGRLPAVRRSRTVFDEVVEGVVDRSPSRSRSDRAWSRQAPRWARSSPTSSSTGSPATWTRAARTAPRRSPAARRYGDKGYFVEPTVLTNTTPDMKVVREEIFGPVRGRRAVPATRRHRRSRQRHRVRSRRRRLDPDIAKAHALAKKLRAGTVWINCYNVFDAALPFGGYKQSGWGREMGHEALEAYTEVKAVTAQL